MEPVAESLRLPESYGKPSKLLAWPDVEARLVEAMHYWLATTRPDGRPHVVPVDGIWQRRCLLLQRGPGDGARAQPAS